MESLNSRSVLSPDPPFMGQTGVINSCFGVLPLSPLLLLLDLQNVLRGIGKAYVESLNSRSVLPPDPPLWAKLGS